MSSVVGSGIDRGLPDGLVLDAWRRELFDDVFQSRSRTLFALVDAIAAGQGRCGCPAHASLTMTPGHAAAYRALRDGQLDTARAVAAACWISARSRLPRIYAIDTTAWPRPHAPTSPDRQPQYTPGGPRGAAMIKTGWRYQHLVRLTGTPDSWVVPVLADRVTSDDTLIEVTVEQIEQVCAADGATRGDPSLFLLDSGYPAARITHQLRQRGICADVLVRLAMSQTMWTRPEHRRAHPLGGRPRRHGFRLPMRDPDLPAQAGISAPVDIYGTITVRAWPHVHPKLTRASAGITDDQPLPIIEGTVLIAAVQHLRPSRRRGDLALWYSGTRTDLLTLAMTYLARYDIEHYFRYLKTTAAAGAFHPRQPATLTTWLRLHGYAYLHLFCARTNLDHHRLPWEPATTTTLTPGQVRRQVSPALHNAWHPPGHAKPGHPGPGRPAGKRRARRTRYPVIRKNAIHKGK